MDSKINKNSSDLQTNIYFQNKRIRQHLIKAGLINRQGDILPITKSNEIILGQQKKQKTNIIIEEERKRQKFLRNYFDLAMKRSRVQKIRDSKHQTQRSMSYSTVYSGKSQKNRNARIPSPLSQKRSLIRPKSAHYPPVNVKNIVTRRPITAKQKPNENLCEVTMIYYGPPKNVEEKKKSWYQSNGDEIIVMQQHCGGENLPVFKGFVKPNRIFTFESRRHSDYPFALALYINGLIDSRISVCCEYKHKHNVRLGSKYGLFGIYDVQKSQPCRTCRFEQRRKEILLTPPIDKSSSPYQKSILTTEFSPGTLLRTPVATPEKEKLSSKRGMNRVSTVVQASRSPKTSESESEKDHSNISNRKKEENSKTSSRSSSRTSDILLKNSNIHHSSEPILTQKDNDDDNNNKSSTTLFDEDTEDDQQIENIDNDLSIRPLSATSSEHSNSIVSINLNKNQDNYNRSRSSSNTTTIINKSNSSSSNISLEKEDNQNDEQSRTSKLSNISFKNEINENLKEQRFSSTSKYSDDFFINNQQENEIINDNLNESDTDLSEDKENFSSNNILLIDTYEYRGMFYQDINNYEKALRYYKKQLNIQIESSLINQSYY